MLRRSRHLRNQSRALRRPRDKPGWLAIETEENGILDAVGVYQMDFMQPNGDGNVDFNDMLSPPGATARVRATFRCGL